MTLNYVLWQLVGPEGLPFLLSFAGGLMVISTRTSKGRRVLGVGLGLLFVISSTPVGYWLLYPLEKRFPSPQITRSPGYIVVLAGSEQLDQSFASGIPEYGEAAERMMAGIALAHRFPSAHIVLVGGIRTKDGISDVSVMRRTAIESGINAKRITLISNTRNTIENAQAAQKIIGDDASTSLLVTSAFHMPRAMLCFKAAGIALTPYPVDHRLWAIPNFWGSWSLSFVKNIERTDAALHEWIGLIFYRLSGKTGSFWPHSPSKALPNR